MTNPSIFMRKGRETISNIYYFWAKIEVKHPQFEIPNDGPATSALFKFRRLQKKYSLPLTTFKITLITLEPYNFGHISVLFLHMEPTEIMVSGYVRAMITFISSSFTVDLFN